MKLAFCIFKYFPYGGLERDFLRIATLAQKNGHDIDIFTMSWEGERPPGMNVHIIPRKGITNHRRCLSFAFAVNQILSQAKYDSVIGFNRMPGLDVYFAGDECFEAKAREHRSWFYRKGTRYFVYSSFEKAIFAPEAKTQILILNKSNQDTYQKVYQTPNDRFHLLPAGVNRERLDIKDKQEVRDKIRKTNNLTDDDFLLLSVGSDFHRKGVDRTMKGIAALPIEIKDKTKLFVIGKGEPKPLLRLSKKLKISKQVFFIGAREDVPNFYFAADLLIHSARKETAGMVLLEALACHLPIIVTANCGYAYHIEDAKAGELVPIPFQQDSLNQILLGALNKSTLAEYRANALTYTQNQDLYSLHDKAVEIIEEIAASKTKN